MGGSTSKRVQPQDLIAFKKLSPYSSLNQEIEIPERPENRVPTDRKFSIVLLVAIIIFLPFCIYTFSHADINRLFGYDKCGNVCGEKNYKYDQWECTGKDLTEKKLLQISGDAARLGENNKLYYYSRVCVSECDVGYTRFSRFCIKNGNNEKSDLETGGIKEDVALRTWSVEIASYLNSVAWKLTLACFISLGLAMSILILFRTATAAMVWSILVGVITLGIIFVGFLWYTYFRYPERQVGIFLFLLIISTGGLLGIIFLIVYLRRKIALVIVLLKEAMKATFDMPKLLLIPIVTFFMEMAIIAMLFTALITISSAGILTKIENGFNFYYRQTIVMSFTSYFTLWMVYWLSQFITAIQYIIISGAVTKWYFSRDKSNMESPILTSIAITFKYHIGTAIFGSMVITLIAIARSILSSIVKSKVFHVCLQCIEDFLAYLTRNAYILTAMHGKPFYKSGKRAAQIIMQNAVKVAVLNYIGDFVIFMAHLIVVLLSLLVTYTIMQGEDGDSPHVWSVYVIVGIISFIVAAICFSIFEIVIDTIFLCFCEDSLLNDGMARPYAMSRDLMEFMDKSKKILGEKK